MIFNLDTIALYILDSVHLSSTKKKT